MAYVDLEKKKKTRSAYNKNEYAATKAHPAMYELYLERQRQKKRNRTIKKQDKLIEEAAKRISRALYGHPHMWDLYLRTATAVLYPERIKGE